MNGYQPEKTCGNCIYLYACTRKKPKGEETNACNEWKECSPPPPPYTTSNAQKPENIINQTHWEKDIYQWCKGYDNDDIEVLTALNGIIRGIYALEGYGSLEDICNRMNVMSEYERLAKGLFNEFDMFDFAVKCEALRALLIGGKINYDFLGDHMAKAVEEYGYIPKEPEKE